MNPLKSTALLGLNDGGATTTFLGTAFAFRSRQHFVTAAHCVGDSQPSVLSITVPITGQALVVAEIHHHPSADIALLTVAQDAPEVEPYWNALGNLNLGHEFFAFGYPENVLAVDARAPTARLFVGHVQRLFAHRSYLGFEYEAIEMSMAAPAGLSGGPLFAPDAPTMVGGVVVENFDSTTLLESIEEVSTPSEKRTIRNQRVISYGIAVHFWPIREWLEQFVPSADEMYAQLRRDRGEPELL